MLDATPLLRAFARVRLAMLDRQDSLRTQQRQLERLLRRARETRFGRDHRFASLSSVEEYQRRVPLRSFEALWEAYWKKSFPVIENETWPGRIPYFAKTSGTSSGTSKYIPVTEAILSGNRRAILDTLSFHLRTHPRSRVFGGKNFMLGGSVGLQALAPGVRAGDMSALAATTVPAWARPYFYPPPDLAKIEDWECRLQALGPASLTADIRTIGGTSSWLLLFLKTLKASQGGLPRIWYPHLELIVYGGVNFAPYRTQFESLVAGTDIDLRENYAASEGFIAVADRGVDEGLRLQVDNGLFYEFVPVDDLSAAQPRRRWLGTVEVGVDYALVLNTPAGLWGYILGDIVRFVELNPPRLLITGRTSTTLSAFGEHLTEDEIVRAVAASAREIGASIVDFSVAPVYPDDEERRGRHLFIVEFESGDPDPERLSRFGAKLDALLSEDNEDYRDHRFGDVQMLAPEVIAVAHGTFADWMRSRGALGGQSKVPRVITDATALADLRDRALRSTHAQPRASGS